MMLLPVDAEVVEGAGNCSFSSMMSKTAEGWDLSVWLMGSVEAYSLVFNASKRIVTKTMRMRYCRTTGRPLYLYITKSARTTAQPHAEGECKKGNRRGGSKHSAAHGASRLTEKQERTSCRLD